MHGLPVNRVGGMHMDAGGDAATEDWGPFGRPLFEDPSARALSRVGVLDVGSNSVRMVVFDGAARSPAYFFIEKVSRTTRCPVENHHPYRV